MYWWGWVLPWPLKRGDKILKIWTGNLASADLSERYCWDTGMCNNGDTYMSYRKKKREYSLNSCPGFIFICFGFVALDCIAAVNSLRQSECISIFTIIDSNNRLSPSHYLNHSWNIVDPNLRNKLQWNLKQNSNIFNQENAIIENVICKMVSILFQPQCVKPNIQCWGSIWNWWFWQFW